MTVVVFLGPSMPVVAARDILDAVYLPPAQQGDIVSIVGTYKPTAIALIDGVFGQSLSVWHKEILYALEQGVRVYGSSSMGALRAAECAAFGMIGVGEIYRQFADGSLNDDDEVALAHAGPEDNHRGLSEPMVNVRATLAAAVDAQALAADAAARIAVVAKQIFFPERTIGQIARDAIAGGESRDIVDAFTTFARAHYVDQKRADAELLLHRLASSADEALPTVSFELARTVFFRALYERDRTVRHDGVDVPLRAIATHAALNLPDFAQLNTHALNRSLVLVLAEILEIQVDDSDIDDEAKRFRMRRRLTTDEALADWLARNDLTPVELREMARDDALQRRLHRWLVTRKFAERTTRLVLDELRARGDYERVARRAAAQERVLAEHVPNFRDSNYPELDLPRLVIDHLRSTPARMDTDYATWSEEAGFADLEDLRGELLRARLARDVESAVTRQLVDALTAPEPRIAEPAS